MREENLFFELRASKKFIKNFRGIIYFPDLCLIIGLGNSAKSQGIRHVRETEHL